LPRLLLIDENLSRRIASELRKRGKNSVAIVGTDLRGAKDPDLLRAIAREYEDAVLVTGDDNMPATHADVLRETRVTVAIIAPEREGNITTDEWEREIVHRWAHRMESQPIGSIRRYYLFGSREWRPRRRSSARRSGT
jgi:predicted nuclease of predicted toxin-antitoxin system